MAQTPDPNHDWPVVQPATKPPRPCRPRAGPGQGSSAERAPMWTYNVQHKNTTCGVCSVWPKDMCKMTTCCSASRVFPPQGRGGSHGGEVRSRVCTHRQEGGEGARRHPWEGTRAWERASPRPRAPREGRRVSRGARPQSPGGHRAHCSHFLAPFLSKCTKFNNLISTPSIHFNFPNILLPRLKNSLKLLGVSHVEPRDAPSPG